jgi:hypothetical protein
VKHVSARTADGARILKGVKQIHKLCIKRLHTQWMASILLTDALYVTQLAAQLRLLQVQLSSAVLAQLGMLMDSSYTVPTRVLTRHLNAMLSRACYCLFQSHPM